MTKGMGEYAFSFNYCDNCIFITSDVSTIKGSYEKIWEMNKDMPKILLYNLRETALDPNNDQKLMTRAKEAKLSCLAQEKVRYLFFAILYSTINLMLS